MPEFVAPAAVKIRKVYFSTRRGVFLGLNPSGQPVWSREDGTKPNRAPSFADYEDMSAYLGDARDRVVPQPDGRLVQVFGSGPDGSATPNDCTASMLPGW